MSFKVVFCMERGRLWLSVVAAAVFLCKVIRGSARDQFEREQMREQQYLISSLCIRDASRAQTISCYVTYHHNNNPTILKCEVST